MMQPNSEHNPLPSDPEMENDASSESADVNADPSEPGSDASLEMELAEAKDKLLRLQAEMENLRRRTRREIEDERKYANLPLMRDLLPVLDNIGRALDAAEKSHDVDSLLEGMRLIAQQLAGALAQHQCTLIEADGQPFDPNVHEAILQQASGEHPPGTVLMVTQSGYKLHDRVIRPSQVIVSKEA